MPINRDDVMRWVADYERAWRAEDAEAFGALFTENEAYRPSPYEPSERSAITRSRPSGWTTPAIPSRWTLRSWQSTAT